MFSSHPSSHPVDGASQGFGVEHYFQLDPAKPYSLQLFGDVVAVFVTYAYEGALPVSKSLRWTALASIFLLVARDGRSMIKFVPWVIHEMRDEFAWKYYPFRQLWSILGGLLPELTVAALLAFLAAIYQRGGYEAWPDADNSHRLLIRTAALAAGAFIVC